MFTKFDVCATLLILCFSGCSPKTVNAAYPIWQADIKDWHVAEMTGRSGNEAESVLYLQSSSFSTTKLDSNKIKLDLSFKSNDNTLNINNSVAFTHCGGGKMFIRGVDVPGEVRINDEIFSTKIDCRGEMSTDKVKIHLSFDINGTNFAFTINKIVKDVVDEQGDFNVKLDYDNISPKIRIKNELNDSIVLNYKTFIGEESLTIPPLSTVSVEDMIYWNSDFSVTEVNSGRTWRGKASDYLTTGVEKRYLIDEGLLVLLDYMVFTMTIR